RESLAELKDVARAAAAAAMPAAKVNLNDPPFVEGANAEAAIMIDVRGASYDDIAPLSQEIGQILRTTPGVQDVQIKYSPGLPEVRVAIDRDKAATLSLPVAQVAMSLRTAIDGAEATKLRQGKDEVPIRVRLQKSDRESQH